MDTEEAVSMATGSGAKGYRRGDQYVRGGAAKCVWADEVDEKLGEEGWEESEERGWKGDFYHIAST